MNQIRSKKLNLFSIILSLSIVGCTGSQEGSLLTDAIPLTDCPQNSCAQGIADPAETKLMLQTPVSNVMTSGSTFAEVAGDCYASLYPQNFFEVSLVNTQNGAAVVGFFPAAFVARCTQGKFYFPINLTGAPNGAYTLSAQLVVVDAQGIQIRPPYKTITSTLIKQ